MQHQLSTTVIYLTYFLVHRSKDDEAKYLLPNTPSWREARLKEKHWDNFTFTLPNIFLHSLIFHLFLVLC
jgi:hypothetical protein